MHSMKRVCLITVWVILLTVMEIGCGNRFATGEPAQTDNDLGQQARGQTVHTTVCMLAKDPGKFDGRRVTVDGCISTDGQEHSSLMDSEAECPSGVLVPVESKDLPSVQRPRADADTIVCGTFVGTFHASTPLYERVLEIDETTTLTRKRR
jgi:hypothetical protein